MVELAWFLYTVANTLTIVFIAKGVGGGRRPPRREPGDDRAPDRRGGVVVPRSDLRDRDRDGGLGAVGGHDRVHVHGAALAAGPPARHGRVRRRLRRAAHRPPVRGRGELSSTSTSGAPTSRTAMLVLAISSVSFVGIGMMTAVLPLMSPEKGTQFGFIAQGLLLVARAEVPGDRPAAVDAVDLGGVARDLRARGRAAGDARRRGVCGDLGRHLAARRDRRGSDPTRPVRVLARRALRQAARAAEAVRREPRPRTKVPPDRDSRPRRWRGRPPSLVCMDIALITGASRGLGLALAQALADRGHGLAIDARGSEGARGGTRRARAEDGRDGDRGRRRRPAPPRRARRGRGADGPTRCS